MSDPNWTDPRVPIFWRQPETGDTTLDCNDDAEIVWPECHTVQNQITDRFWVGYAETLRTPVPV